VQVSHEAFEASQLKLLVLTFFGQKKPRSVDVVFSWRLQTGEMKEIWERHVEHLHQHLCQRGTFRSNVFRRDPFNSANATAYVFGGSWREGRMGTRQEDW